jgi:2-aminoadipate transaminase
LKQGADLHTSTFTQIVVYEVARDGFLDEHVKVIRRVYCERRNVMLEALTQYFPAEVTWTRPKGGLFLWVTLAEGMDAQKLFDTAIRENVAFVPGDSFYAPNGHSEEGRLHLRLNFSAAASDQICEGIRRLSIAVRRQLDELHPLPAGSR